MENNLVFRWPKPLFFMVLGAHGTKTKKILKINCTDLCAKKCHEKSNSTLDVEIFVFKVKLTPDSR